MDQRPVDARDPVAQLNDKLETIIELIRYALGFETQYMDDADMARSPVALSETSNMLQELLLASLMPSAPESTEEFAVGNIEVTLAENESLPLVRVEVTNDDVAQPLWVSHEGVLVATGRIIMPQTTEAFVLPEGERLAGICVIPAVSVRVSYGYDFYNILNKIRQRERAGERTWTVTS